MEATEKLWAKREKAEEMREIKKKERNIDACGRDQKA